MLRRAAVAGFIAFSVAVVVAKVWTMVHAGFGRGDVVPFGIWTAPFALGAGVLTLFSGKSSWPQERRTRLIIWPALGALWGVSWTYVVAWGMGPWFGAMSVPMIWILPAAGAIGLLWHELLRASEDATAGAASGPAGGGRPT
jgi:hypothetical protein